MEEVKEALRNMNKNRTAAEDHLVAEMRQTGHEELMSEEGSTQGDVTAMAMYALGNKPLLDKLIE